jgi:hypothetical protein
MTMRTESTRTEVTMIEEIIIEQIDTKSKIEMLSSIGQLPRLLKWISHVLMAPIQRSG